MTPTGPVRLSVNISPKDNEDALLLARRKGITMSDHVRSSITTMLFLDKEIRQDGKKLVLEDETGDIERLLFRWS